MTRNEQIRLCQIACQNQEKEMKDYIVYFCFEIILALLALVVLFYILPLENDEKQLFMKIVVLILSIGILFDLFSIYSNYRGYKAFVNFINMHEYEIVVQKQENEDWYFVHIPDTDVYVAAEKV